MASDVGMKNLEEQVKNLTTMLQETDAGRQTLADNADHFFLIVIAIIIFFMQCGFAFLEAGSVR